MEPEKKVGEAKEVIDQKALLLEKNIERNLNQL